MTSAVLETIVLNIITTSQIFQGGGKLYRKAGDFLIFLSK